MQKNIPLKLLVCLVVLVIFGAVGVYPIIANAYGITSPAFLMGQQLKLGLDLKGGVHLVLRVQTDDALRLETEQEMERVRELMRTRNIPATSITAPGIQQFRVEGVPSGQDAEFRTATADSLVNFDRSPGTNGAYTFTLKANVQAALRSESMMPSKWYCGSGWK